MYACYHTHTQRCQHALGTDEEYVLAAIAEGVSVLGFSDHAPMPYRCGYVSNYKMTVDELSEYCGSILALKEKYADKIEIHIGFETEYYPSLWDASVALWRDYPIEYLILGQHFVGEETDPDRDPSTRPSSDTGRLIKYVDRTIAGMRRIHPSCIAHPDLLNYTGADLDLYREEMGRLIRCAMELKIPLEYNLLGMSGGRSYPKPIFWEEAARLGAPAIIGCDAHSPDRVANPGEIATAKSFLDKLGVNLIDRFPLVKPF